MSIQFFPAIVIGGGVGGISCAIELQYNAIEYLLLDDQAELGGQLPLIKTKIRNLGGLYFADGTVLQKQVNEYVQAQNIRFKARTKVISCNLYEKTVETEHGLYRGQTLIIATGARIRALEVDCEPGLREQLVYFTEKNEAAFAGLRVVVIGGGDYAAITCLDLCKHAIDVTLLARSKTLTCRPDLLKLLQASDKVKLVTNKKILAIKGTGKIEAIAVEDLISGEQTTLPSQAVVVKIGCTPNTELFAPQLPLTEGGYIDVNAQLQTAIPGVFAVGDVLALKNLRISTAMGQGATAALSAMQYLLSKTSTAVQ